VKNNFYATAQKTKRRKAAPERGKEKGNTILPEREISQAFFKRN
jgi:hypothetical protein